MFEVCFRRDEQMNRWTDDRRLIFIVFVGLCWFADPCFGLSVLIIIHVCRKLCLSAKKSIERALFWVQQMWGSHPSSIGCSNGTNNGAAPMPMPSPRCGHIRMIISTRFVSSSWSFISVNATHIFVFTPTLTCRLQCPPCLEQPWVWSRFESTLQPSTNPCQNPQVQPPPNHLYIQARKQCQACWTVWWPTRAVQTTKPRAVRAVRTAVLPILMRKRLHNLERSGQRRRFPSCDGLELEIQWIRRWLRPTKSWNWSISRRRTCLWLTRRVSWWGTEPLALVGVFLLLLLCCLFCCGVAYLHLFRMGEYIPDVCICKNTYLMLICRHHLSTVLSLKETQMVSTSKVLRPTTFHFKPGDVRWCVCVCDVCVVFVMCGVYMCVCVCVCVYIHVCVCVLCLWCACVCVCVISATVVCIYVSFFLFCRRFSLVAYIGWMCWKVNNNDTSNVREEWFFAVQVVV